MGAENPKRRPKTARQMAEEQNVSVRLVRKIMAEPREEFLSRAAAKREQAQRLWDEGYSYRQIAEEMGIKLGSVSSLLHPEYGRRKAAS